MNDSKVKVIENNFDIWWKKTTNRQPSKNFASSVNYDSLHDRYFLLKNLFLTNYGKLKVKDIFTYNYQTLEEELNRIVKNQVKKGEDFEILINNKNYLVVHCKTLKGTIKFSWGTKWCTVMEHHFKSYSDKIIIRFINKNETQDNPNYKLSLTFTKNKFGWRGGSLINSKDKNLVFLSMDSLYKLKDLFEKSGFDFTEKEVNKLLTYIKEN